MEKFLKVLVPEPGGDGAGDTLDGSEYVSNKLKVWCLYSRGLVELSKTIMDNSNPPQPGHVSGSSVIVGICRLSTCSPAALKVPFPKVH